MDKAFHRAVRRDMMLRNIRDFLVAIPQAIGFLAIVSLILYFWWLALK